MLSFPVYAESHPRRMAAHAASCISSNSFASYSFRTLASHLKATVSSNSFEFKRFRTLCKIPGIGYPPSLNFISHSFAQCALCDRTDCAPRAQNQRTNGAFFRNNSFACHTCIFSGGEGGYLRNLRGIVSHSGARHKLDDANQLPFPSLARRLSSSRAFGHLELRLPSSRRARLLHRLNQRLCPLNDLLRVIPAQRGQVHQVRSDAQRECARGQVLRRVGKIHSARREDR